MNQQHDRRWRDAALCTQIDPEIFFPEVGETPHAAQRVCGCCPVQATCLADALNRRDVAHGVLGGMTPNERRRLLQEQDGVRRMRRAA